MLLSYQPRAYSTKAEKRRPEPSLYRGDYLIACLLRNILALDQKNSSADKRDTDQGDYRNARAAGERKPRLFIVVHFSDPVQIRIVLIDIIDDVCDLEVFAFGLSV